LGPLFRPTTRPNNFLGDLTPGGAQGGRHEQTDSCDDNSEAAVE